MAAPHVPELPPSPETTLVVLLGASEYPRKPVWSNPVLGASARAVCDYFTSSSGMSVPAEQVLDLFDNSVPAPKQCEHIDTFLQDRSHARDLIIYYIGHGEFDDDREYYLGVQDTLDKRESLTAIEPRKLGKIIRERFGRKRVYVILDSCFAASAAGYFQGAILEAAVRRISKPLPTRGTAFLAASSKDDLTYARRNKQYTDFTGALLGSLQRGILDRPERLSLYDLYGEIRDTLNEQRELAEDGPELHAPNRGDGEISRLPLFPNVAWIRARRQAEAEAKASAEARAKADADAPARKATPAARVAERWELVEQTGAGSLARVARDHLPLTTGAIAGHDGLAAAAQLLHSYCVEEVALATSALGSTPRTCKCRDCAALWLATEAGAVMRIRLCPGEQPAEAWFSGDPGVQTIYHLHDSAALGSGAFLLLGRDDGTLDIVPDRHPDWSGQPPSYDPRARARFHLDSWWACRDERNEIAVGDGVKLKQHGDRGSPMGVTAIAVLARPGRPDVVDILVATRFPWLYVIEAASGRMQMRRRIPLPGWIQWIIGPPHAGDRVVCISTTGDVIRFSRDELLEGTEGHRTELSLLVSAAMPLGDDTVLLGTTTGLVLVRADRVTGPATRARVLCLAGAAVDSGHDRHDCVAIGLDDGSLYITDTDALLGPAEGDPPRASRRHDFVVEMGGAVLAIEVLPPDAATQQTAHMLAVLRDDSLCLLRVTSRGAVESTIASLWEDHVRRHAEVVPPVTPFAAELAAASAPAPDGCDTSAWSYLLVDAVIPRLRAMARSRDEHLQIVRLACMTAAHADGRVLHRLSRGLGQLAGDDVGLVLELSRCVLGAVPHGRDDPWSAFIDAHVRELNALAGQARDSDRARLLGWARFVRTYVLLGHTFAAQRTGLLELVEQNYLARRYLDALIYLARLAQRCYDLRWETQVGYEVAALHVVSHDGGPAIVVIATEDGKLVFLDGGGRRLTIRDGARIVDVLAPFGEARTLACAVAREHKVFRVVLSCSGARVPPPGLAVYDLQSEGTSAVDLITSVSKVTCAAPVQVHALQALPGRPGAFVAGLDTHASPVGLLHHQASDWTLEIANHDATIDSPDAEGSWSIARPSLAQGTMPTRALAVATTDDSGGSYLVVAGSDDGLVRAIWFAQDDLPRNWTLLRWDRMGDAITSIRLGRHSARPAPDEDYVFSCYVSTANDTIAMAISARDTPGPGADILPAGDPDRHVLWREPHAGPVLGMHLWRTTLYDPTTVLVVVTQNAGLRIYNHEPSAASPRVSALYNYYFAGIRFARIAIPDRLRALAMVQDGGAFVAAGPGGRLYMAQLVYLSGSVERSDPEQRSTGPGPEHSRDHLPRELWARMHHLFAASAHDWPFEADVHEPDARRRLKLELCELIHLDGTALSSYALRERLLFHEPWDDLDAGALRTRALALLRPLDPENPEHAEQIKIVIRSLCRARLFRHPGELANEILAMPGATPARRAETAEICELVARYIERLAYASSAAARLRCVAIKELVRVPVLRHMACDDPHGQRVRHAVQTALDRCLRDDDRVVRSEALRALSVLLRNVGIMADAAAGDRDRLLATLLPRGLGSLTWFLELIVGDLLRLPSLTLRSEVVGGAWDRIAALVPVFRIFPDRSLALCDYLTRAGLGIEVIAACCRSLRGRRYAAIQSRITQLYLVPVLEQVNPRAQYIAHYDRRQPGFPGLGERARLVPHTAPAGAYEWYHLDDTVMAERLLYLLDQLARMWGVSDRETIGELAAFRPAPTQRDAPLAALERVVAELASVAADLAGDPSGQARALDRLAELRDRHGSSAHAGSGLTAPLRTIVAGVIAQWGSIYIRQRT